MWMQKSMEGTSFSSPGTYDRRDRFNSSSSDQFRGSNFGGNGGYGGSLQNTSKGDWKDKIMEGGQWLGGKVIEYSGRALSRTTSHDTIPEQYHVGNSMNTTYPRNDGRADWMADIRNSSSSTYQQSNVSSFSSGNTYQNSFITERPQAYSDKIPFQSSRSSNDSIPFSTSSNVSKTKEKRHAKKAKDRKKKSKKTKKYETSSDSSNESERSSENESDISNDDKEKRKDRKNKKSKVKGNKNTKSKSKKHPTSNFYSEESDCVSNNSESSSNSSSEDDLIEETTKKLSIKGKAKSSSKSKSSKEKKKIKAKHDVDITEKVKSKSGKTRKAKKSSKTKRRQSMEDSETDSAESIVNVKATSESESSEKEQKKVSRNTKASTKTTKGRKANGKVKSNEVETLDLLGVDELQINTSVQEMHTPSVFDTNPLQDLAGLEFQKIQTLPEQSVTSNQLQDQDTEKTKENDHIQSMNKLLPDNQNLIDLSAHGLLGLGTSQSKSLESKKTLNEIQSKTQRPVMTMPMSMQAPMNNPQQMYIQQSQPMMITPYQLQQMQMQQMQMQQMQQMNSIQTTNSQVQVNKTTTTTTMWTGMNPENGNSQLQFP